MLLSKEYYYFLRKHCRRSHISAISPIQIPTEVGYREAQNPYPWYSSPHTCFSLAIDNSIDGDLAACALSLSLFSCGRMKRWPRNRKTTARPFKAQLLRLSLPDPEMGKSSFLWRYAPLWPLAVRFAHLYYFVLYSAHPIFADDAELYRTVQ